MKPTLEETNSNQQIRDLYNLVRGFVGLLSRDGIVLDINRSALEFIGASLSDVVNKPFWETPWWRDSPRSRDALIEAIRRAAFGEASRFDAEHTGKNGEMINVDFSLTPIQDETGEVVSLVPEARNITDFKATLEALQESESRLRLAQDAAEIGTWDWDLDTGELNWDDRQFALFGFPKNTPRVQVDDAIAAIHEDDIGRVKEAMVLSTKGTMPFREIFRVIHPNGEVHWLVGRGAVLKHDDDGKPLSMVGVNYDITEQKELEAQLEQANRELEARIKRRTRQLEREIQENAKAQEALAHTRRLDAIGQLAGGLAHDLNNLLAIIGGNLELVEMRIDDTRLKQPLRDALEAVDSGASLTKRLLAFARKRSLKPSRLTVNNRIENTKQLLKRTLDENIDLRTTLAPDLWNVFVDAGELDSAILNLALNSRDAMPSGGTLDITAQNVVVNEQDIQEWSDVEPGEYVLLSIADTGIGMSPEIMRQAITPFFTTKEVGRGSGLGLSSVFGFAKQSNGFLDIESAEGAGTTINIYLPRAALPGAGEAHAAATGVLPEGHGETILLVEDDIAVRKVTYERLLELGYRVIEATTAHEAINLLESDAPVSLVFSDIRMPGTLSGTDLAEWTQTHRPEIGVLLTSGYYATDPGDDGLSANESVQVLAKPYSIDTLASALRDALAARSDFP